MEHFAQRWKVQMICSDTVTLIILWSVYTVVIWVVAYTAMLCRYDYILKSLGSEYVYKRLFKFRVVGHRVIRLKRGNFLVFTTSPFLFHGSTALSFIYKSHPSKQKQTNSKISISFILSTSLIIQCILVIHKTSWRSPTSTSRLIILNGNAESTLISFGMTHDSIPLRSSDGPSWFLWIERNKRQDQVQHNPFDWWPHVGNRCAIFDHDEKLAKKLWEELQRILTISSVQAITNLQKYEQPQLLRPK